MKGRGARLGVLAAAILALAVPATAAAASTPLVSAATTESASSGSVGAGTTLGVSFNATPTLASSYSITLTDGTNVGKLSTAAGNLSASISGQTISFTATGAPTMSAGSALSLSRPLEILAAFGVSGSGGTWDLVASGEVNNVSGCATISGLTRVFGGTNCSIGAASSGPLAPSVFDVIALPTVDLPGPPTDNAPEVITNCEAGSNDVVYDLATSAQLGSNPCGQNNPPPQDVCNPVCNTNSSTLDYIPTPTLASYEQVGVIETVSTSTYVSATAVPPQISSISVSGNQATFNYDESVVCQASSSDAPTISQFTYETPYTNVSRSGLVYASAIACPPSGGATSITVTFPGTIPYSSGVRFKYEGYGDGHFIVGAPGTALAGLREASQSAYAGPSGTQSQLAVTGLSPASGPTTGGTTVTISGSGFTGATKVTFGSTAATSFKVVSDTQITAVAPAQSVSTQDVLVTTPNGTSPTVAADQYSYTTQSSLPAVSGLSPTSGPTAGGNTVTINGSGFTGATKVAFGAIPASGVTVVSDTQITAVAPAQGASTVNVFVTTPNGTSAQVSSDAYTYVAPTTLPVVTGVSPSSGPTTGGTTVTITGSGFTGATWVGFGGVTASSYTVVSDTQITAVAPAQAASTHNIYVVTAKGSSSAVAADQYTYTTQTSSAPSVSGLSPTSGTTAGGNTVTINGSGFTGATKVAFGSTAATSFKVVSDTQITAVAPAQGASTQNVFVTTPNGTSAQVAADAYTYVTPSTLPAVSGLSPTSGTTAGGNTVTINGSGFTGATKVMFGSTAASSYKVISDTQITAIAPAQGTSTVNVFVTTPSGTSAQVAADAYSYVAPSTLPAVSGLSPTSGPTAGGNTVTINGSGFSGATKVAFGSTAATSFKVVSDTQITAVAPAQGASTQNVFVTTPNGTSAQVAADAYSYVAPSTLPVVTGISPTSGPTTGGTTVTITGSGFTGATWVGFGGVTASSWTVVSDTEITAVAPPQAASTHNIYVVTAKGSSSAVTADRFTYN